MTTDTLKKFLLLANKETYANKDAKKVGSSRLESEDYEFRAGNSIYHDTYFGGRDFIGGEIVYEDEKPVWGANYFGFILDHSVEEKEVYDFLRQALMSDLDSVVPVRGPASFTVGSRVYTFSVEGDLSNFVGKEKIEFAGHIVYRCCVHGGFVR